MNFPDITYHLILPALQKIAELTHSYGWGIILLTIIFRVLVSPLVAQTTISMRRMSKLQPQMKMIQERYKSNPEQLQKKLVEFYAKNKVNPLGGCLPTLVQLPILFALYAAFAGPPFTDKLIDVKVNVVKAENAQSVKREEESGSNSIYVSKDGKPAKVVVFPGNSTFIAGTDVDFGVRAVEGKLPPDFAPQWHMTYKDTEGKDHKVNITPAGHVTFANPGEYHIQASIPGIAKNESFAFVSGLGKVATGASLLKPANFDVVFLILLFGITMYLSQKLTVPTPKPANGQELDEQQIIQQQTMKTMPLVTTAMFFFFPIPAGVYLYLVVSNVIQTFQTWLVARMPEPEFVSDDDNVIEAETGNNGGQKSLIKPNKKPANNNNGKAENTQNKNVNETSNKQQKKKSKRKK